MALDVAAGLDILVAEDTAVNAQLYRVLLENAGHRVVVAEHGVEAVEKATGGRFDLILMDLGLPRITGLEAAERIRAAGVETPIIALTAEDDPSSKRACDEVGMNGFLHKPIRPAELLRAVAAPLAV